MLDSGNAALNNVHMSGGARDSIFMNKLISRFEDQQDKQEGSDSEEDERDKKFAPPPAYFKKFFFSSDAMAPPDLESLLKKDYSILY